MIHFSTAVYFFQLCHTKPICFILYSFSFLCFYICYVLIFLCDAMSFSSSFCISLVVLLFYLFFFPSHVISPFCLCRSYSLSHSSVFSLLCYILHNGGCHAGRPCRPPGFWESPCFYVPCRNPLPSLRLQSAQPQVSAASKPPQADTWDPLPARGVPQEAKEEEECLVDSQPICFCENPFLVANRKSKGCPPKERILSGPPVGYGSHGQLQPWLYSKASSLGECVFWQSVFSSQAWCVISSYLELT